MNLLAADSTASTALSYWPIAVVGGLAMLVLAALQYKRFTLGGRFSTSFMKAYGLILVATLGAVLAFAQVTDGARTGAFTLLGTIAGYLAGTQPPATTLEVIDPVGGGEGPNPPDGAPPRSPAGPGVPDDRRGVREEPLG